MKHTRGSSESKLSLKQVSTTKGPNSSVAWQLHCPPKNFGDCLQTHSPGMQFFFALKHSCVHVGVLSLMLKKTGDIVYDESKGILEASAE